MNSARIRLYVEHPLGQGQTVPLNRDQAHYLSGVMRQSVGDRILVFNGRDGEWSATIVALSRREALLEALSQTAPQTTPPDLWLLFAPIKKARTDFIVEKATEMGAARIVPVQTDFTNSERIHRDRLQAHAVEAAEQCGGTFVPEVATLGKLDTLLHEWPAGRRLMFCDEALSGRAPVSWIGLERGQPWAILIGPEGGFSDAERRRLHDFPGAQPVSLGPRILRADTAAVAALTLWQITCGDWT